MKNYIQFWIAALVRGLAAILVGCAILLVPDLSTTLLLLPFAIAISIVCLASYGVIDSAIVFFASFMAASKVAKLSLRLQGIAGAAMGMLFLTIVFDHVRLRWFLYLIATQALCTAASEFVVARHMSTKHGSRWNYAAATVAFLCGIAYAFAAIVPGDSLLPIDITRLIYGYLLAFGLAQCLTASRMLYEDAHVRGQQHVPA